MSKLKEVIIKAVPSILDLEMGCYFSGGGYHLEHNTLDWHIENKPETIKYLDSIIFA